MDKTEKTIQSNLLFEGKVIRVYHDRVLCPNGKESMREIVQHKGGVAAVVLNEKQEIYFVNQYRYALQSCLWEIPAGKLEIGEEPDTAILRELEEEIGVIPQTLYSLGEIIPTCGYCSEKIHLYLATDLTYTSPHPDEDEALDIITVPLADAIKQCQNGDITDAKTICALMRLNGEKRQVLL